MCGNEQRCCKADMEINEKCLNETFENYYDTLVHMQILLWSADILALYTS